MLIGSDQAVLAKLEQADGLKRGTALNVGELQGKLVAAVRGTPVGLVPSGARAQVVEHLQAGGRLAIAEVHSAEDGALYVFFRLTAIKDDVVFASSREEV